MNLNLDTLISIIGKREVTEILVNHLSKNYNKPTELKVPKVNNKGHRVLGAKPWTDADEQMLVQRVTALRMYPETKWSKVRTILAKELYRTPSAIGNRIGLLQRQGAISK